jgi:hypothetical protein
LRLENTTVISKDASAPRPHLSLRPAQRSKREETAREWAEAVREKIKIRFFSLFCPVKFGDVFFPKNTRKKKRRCALKSRVNNIYCRHGTSKLFSSS